MKIFQLIFLPDIYQTLCQKDNEVKALRICVKGKSRLEIWPDHLDLEVTEPIQPRGIFLQWGAGEFVLTKEAREDKTLVSLLEMNGEFLPVVADGESLLLHNITRFYECVDQERSKWGITIGDVPGRIEKPRFIKDAVKIIEYPIIHNLALRILYTHRGRLCLGLKTNIDEP